MATATAKSKIKLSLDGIERACLLVIIDDLVDVELLQHRLGIDLEGAGNIINTLEGIATVLTTPEEMPRG